MICLEVEQAQRLAAANRSRHKGYGGNSIPGAIFYHIIPEMDFYHSRHLSRQKQQ